jgi:uncharacterized membrane protein YdjX (TVP38/TMEM64 family)
MVVAIIVVAGNRMLDTAGVDNSPEALGAWIESFGWWGPAAYVGLLAMRHFLLLPSTLMLALGGAALGVGLGGVAGSIGLLCSAVGEFWVFRVLKPHRLVAQMEERAGNASVAVERGTPLAIFAATAIPPMPMTFVYWAASLTPISIPRFAAYAGSAGVIRAFALSLLGAGVVAADAGMIGVAVGACLLLLAAVFAVPSLRALLIPPSRS